MRLAASSIRPSARARLMRDEETGSSSTTSGSTEMQSHPFSAPISETRSRVPARARPNALSGVIVMPRSSIAGARAARNTSGSRPRSSVVKTNPERMVDPGRRQPLERHRRRQEALYDGAGPDHLIRMRAEDECDAGRISLSGGHHGGVHDVAVATVDAIEHAQGHHRRADARQLVEAAGGHPATSRGSTFSGCRRFAVTDPIPISSAPSNTAARPSAAGRSPEQSGRSVAEGVGGVRVEDHVRERQQVADRQDRLAEPAVRRKRLQPFRGECSLDAQAGGLGAAQREQVSTATELRPEVAGERPNVGAGAAA